MTVLNTIKKMLGVPPLDDTFDTDITIYINTAINYLYQMGIDNLKKLPFIEKTTTWDEIIGEDPLLECTKTYIYLQVKLMFDPPTSATVTESYNRTIKQIEWRLTNITLKTNQ